MTQLPIKYKILAILSDGNAHWNNDIVYQLQNEYSDLKGDYGRDSANFDMIELASNGLIKTVEFKIDDGGSYKQGSLLHKYTLTDIGWNRAKYAGVCAGGN
ncbi:MAG: hypothetical protein LBU81_04805 [Methanosarcinales archaeon]|jgi:hypothetical protein|nr:hypothetical protein [Methanosarcinales archaeon]